MSDQHLANDLVSRLDAMNAADTPHFANELMREASSEIELLRKQRKELARLLKYATTYSSLAEHMNPAWREDSLAALDVPKEVP